MHFLSSGGSNCLVLAALFVLINQFKQEKTIDLFRTVKHMNSQRYNVKINIVSFILNLLTKQIITIMFHRNSMNFCTNV